MTPIDCPFKTFDAILSGQTDHVPHSLYTADGGLEVEPREPVILVDFHAESTEEKEALGFYLDGRASVVAGTHTHVQTADERTLPKGTGYITDLGMTGPKDSVIGMDTKICLDRVRTQILYRMECAKGSASIQGMAAEIDGETGKAVSIQRFNRTA
jgi:calcineurin-like phosphoesterase